MTYCCSPYVRMGPFPCPNCGHELLADRLKGEGGTITPVTVLDMTTLEEGKVNDSPSAGFASMGRWRLEWLAFRQEKEIFKLKRTIETMSSTWWGKLFWLWRGKY